MDARRWPMTRKSKRQLYREPREPVSCFQDRLDYAVAPPCSYSVFLESLQIHNIGSLVPYSLLSQRFVVGNLANLGNL
jgi:hypothetical protein